MAADRPFPSESNRCSACGADPGSNLACLACGLILDPGRDPEHFANLGLDSLATFDPAIAELNYLKLSRLLHPDFQAGRDERTQALAVRNSSLLNEAWKILNDDQMRSEYLIELYDPGVLERHKALSPEFLMEAMEVSEELDDAQTQGCKKTVQKIANSARTEIETRMKDVASACAATIARLAHKGPQPGETLPAKQLSTHDSNTEQIAVLLHQARVYRRILRDTENAR